MHYYEYQLCIGNPNLSFLSMYNQKPISMPDNLFTKLVSRQGSLAKRKKRTVVLNFPFIDTLV